LAPPRLTRSIIFLVIALLVVVGLAFFAGRYPQPYFMPPRLLVEDELAQRLVFNLRLPRILAAMLLGMTLGACGTVLQMVFRNPLIEPGFLGVTQGAAFGAAFSILFIANSPLVIELIATGFALGGLALTNFLARRLRYGGWVLRMILAGIAVSALFSSGVGVLKYMADPLTQLPEITFWMLGGLWSVTWRDLLYLLPLVLPGLLVVYLMRWRLNLLALSDETAFSLGARPGRERALLVGMAVTATAAVTAVSGVIGWVGLIVPHLARRLFGANASYSLPVSMLAGGIFTVLCDTLARTLLAGEIPLGILTSLIGATVFMVMLMSSQVKLR
jgi:iron complex transport system permease protein